MKLFYDARYIRTDFHDGISRYTAELGNALARLTPVTFLISDEAQRKHLPENAHCILIHSPTSPREVITSLLLNKYQPDVVFSPMQTLGSFGRKFKLILTLHDLIYYKHRTPPPAFNHAIRAGWWLFHTTYVPQRIILNNADMVATVSQASRDEILRANLTKKPVVVVSNASRDLSQLLPKSSRKPLSKKPKNLVYMGAFIPYKNVETLIQAMEFLPGRTLHLLSRIRPERKAELTKLIPEKSTVIFHGGVSDEEYAEILTDDAIMVSASKAEGYGLPLAEALSLGVPAVVSDLDIFHEVAGDGALYADPDDPQSFAARVAELDNIKFRDDLIEKGKKNIAKFNWDHSAKELLRAIKTL